MFTQSPFDRSATVCFFCVCVIKSSTYGNVPRNKSLQAVCNKNRFI